MDVSDVTPQLEQLEQELNKAQDVLKPLLGDIGDISSKLPLLDKAKLYVLVAYTIESLLFCETHSSFFPSLYPLTHDSLTTPEWSGYQKPCHLHRVDPGKAVH